MRTLSVNLAKAEQAAAHQNDVYDTQRFDGSVHPWIFGLQCLSGPLFGSQ